MQPKQKTESVLLSLLVILVLVGIYFWNKNSSTPTYPTVSDQVTTTNTTPVVPVDTSTTNFGVNLPDGFPSDIPVELGNITTSQSTQYNSVGYIQYSVTYTSTKSKADKWKEYSDYMKTAGYVLGKIGNDQTQGTLYGSKSGRLLSVLVASGSNGTIVGLSVVNKK